MARSGSTGAAVADGLGRAGLRVLGCLAAEPGPLAAPGAGAVDVAPSGRRTRIRQSPSRTSTSPRPVPVSFATSAGTSVSERRARLAWSACRWAGVRSAGCWGSGMG